MDRFFAACLAVLVAVAMLLFFIVAYGTHAIEDRPTYSQPGSPAS